MPATTNHTPLIVGIGGTTRGGSTSEKTLSAALAMARSMGARTLQVSGPDLIIEIYQPEISDRSARAQQLTDAIKNADGLLIASPSYHGSLSGMLKNALDYIEDLRDDARPYLEDRAVGCIVCADGVQALGSTLHSLRAIIHALRGWPTPYAATLSASDCRQAFDEHGKLTDADIASQLKTVVEQVVSFADARFQKAALPSGAGKQPKTALSA